MDFENGKIRLGKELSELDRRVLEFTGLLESLEIDHVLVSGYVAILLGRSRGSEDIDILADIDRQEFRELWEKLQESGYWCINAGKEEAWSMLEDGLSVRFAREGEAVPNFEVFKPDERYGRRAMDQSVEVELDSESIPISPLELQIVYKLWMGSQKDFEDALHIYTVAGENLENGKLEELATELGVENELGELETEAEKGKE